MKKLLLSVLTITTLGFAAKAQIVNIPDANFKTYLVGNASINTNGDTEIQTSEASAFTGNINCYNNSIADLTGIEAFVAIGELNCSNNLLTTLDISQNITLAYLTCGSNQLSILDVSNNTALQALSCDNNVIATLDLTTNSALSFLECYNNSLTALNVANGNNANISFTDFDATGNPNLTCIQVDNPTYSSSNWSAGIDATASFSLNCSGCAVNIPNANFKAYLVGNTAINTNGDTEIQCSEASAFTGMIFCPNLSISDLTGIEAFTALTELYCHNNSLSSLDVTQNTALILFNCQNNLLSNLNIPQSPNLLGLWCSINSLSSLDLTQNTALNQLFCNDNSLTSLNVANGNNSNFAGFNATNNANLTCIQVDNVAYSTTNWTNIDATASFSLNCSGSVGVNEQVSQSSLMVYPNPATSQLTIDLGISASLNGQNQIITILDVTGKTVKTIITNNNTIDVSNLVKGIYFLQVQTEKGIINSKFIKE